MALIKSISGIRGTIGGRAGEGLTPLDIVRFSAAYAKFMKQNAGNDSNKIVVGRDARISGDMVYHLVAGTLSGQGLEVVNIGLATTPTTELAVIYEKALGGIILTASHNPMQWNALKLLNEKGEFLNAKEGEEVLKIAAEENFDFASVEQLGKISENFTFLQKHIDNILSLNLVEVDAIKKADFTVAIDAVNSVGGIAVPALLEALGVKKVIKLDVGFVVDPDVDRLAIICEDGSMFGEEYTLVAVADYVLQHTPGNTVSNLSSSRALRDITQKRGGKYSAAAVGEVNVVTLMKQTNAVIGGEGNGGVIYPASHYGRDALVGIALFLSYLAKSKKTVSALKNEYPQYFISKNKIELTPSIDVDKILATIKNNYQLQYEVNDIDGVKIDFPTGWVHLRKSNTEPIIRIYAEAKTKEQAEAFANAIMEEIRRIAAA